MRILFASTSSNNVTPFINSLTSLGEHEISVFHYDRAWNELAQSLAQSDPAINQALLEGRWPPPEIRAEIKARVSGDAALLDAVRERQPDVVIYISAWEGLFVPSNDTLRAVKAMAPLVHFLCDGGDPPWWPQLKAFEEADVFTLTVNIDGSPFWPGRESWKSNHGWQIERALTLLTPLDPRTFEGPPLPPEWTERPFAVAYAGNFGGWTRSQLVQQVQKQVPELSVRQRDNGPMSYRMFCDFLRFARVLISVPFTGSGATQHVKGRILEGGYAECCLLEWDNFATQAWFEPMRDYIPYTGIEDCADWAKFLVRKPGIAETVAANLNHRVRNEHAPEIFWGKVFAELRR